MGNELKVEDLMTARPVTLRSIASVAEGRMSMKLARSRHLPLVDELNRFVGFVSDRDLIRAEAEKRTGPLAEFMTTEVRTVPPEMPAREALKLILDLRIGALPVLDAAGRLVGVITETDFLEFAHRELSAAGEPRTRDL